MVNMKKVLIGLLGIGLMVSVGCGKSMVAESSVEKLVSLSVSPVSSSLKIGEKVDFKVTGRFNDGYECPLKYYSAYQSVELGELENHNEFAAEYPGKTEIKYSASVYQRKVAQAGGANASGMLGGNPNSEPSSVYASVIIDVSPKDNKAPSIPIMTIKEQTGGFGKYYRVSVTRDQNTEWVELAYGSDEQASNGRLITNKSNYKTGEVTIYDWYENTSGDSYADFLFDSDGNNHYIKSNSTYYVKVRAVNRYGKSEWSAIKVLAEGTQVDENIIESENNVGEVELEDHVSVDINNDLIRQPRVVIDRDQIEGIKDRINNMQGKLTVRVYTPDGSLATTGEVWVYIWTPHVQGVVPTNIAWEQAVNGIATFILPAGEYGWSADLRDANGNIVAGAGSMYQNFTVQGSIVNVLEIYLQNI